MSSEGSRGQHGETGVPLLAGALVADGAPLVCFASRYRRLALD